MNEEKTYSLKDVVIIIAGIITSLAGLVYLMKQYSKALLSLLKVFDEEEIEKTAEKITPRFRQVMNTETEVPPVSEEDLAVEISD